MDNDYIISLGYELEDGIVELSSLVGQLVKTFEEFDDEDVASGHPRAFGFGIDVWNSKEFILEQNFPSTQYVNDVIETVEQNVVCVVTDTFGDQNSDHGGALEVITPSGVCGWVSVYDVIRTKS